MCAVCRPSIHPLKRCQVMCVQLLTCPKQSRDQILQSTRMSRSASCPGSVQHWQLWEQPGQHQTLATRSSYSSTEALFQLEKTSRWSDEEPKGTLKKRRGGNDCKVNPLCSFFQSSSAASKERIIRRRAVSVTQRLKWRGGRRQECCGSHRTGTLTLLGR